MAGLLLVSNPTRTPRGRTVGTSSVAGLVKSTSPGVPKPKHRMAKPTRVAAIRKQLRKSGFSETACVKITRRNQTSTLSVYESRWAAFVEWCRVRKVDPVKATIPIIADFLLELFDKNFSVGSLRVYRSAISTTLKHFGRDIGGDKNSCNLLSSLAIERPRPLRVMPTWDLSFVLHFLRGRHFEPLVKTDLLSLSLKTEFLIAFGIWS
jgi:hypothetical protein